MTIDPRSDEGDLEAVRRAISMIDPTLTATYEREVTAELVADFARVSGDFYSLHLDRDYASTTPFERPIAHGALLLAFMSTVTSILSDNIEAALGIPNVALGYDRVRFTAPVFVGDTITTRTRVAELQPDRLRVVCELDCRTENDQVVGVATHIMRFFAYKKKR